MRASKVQDGFFNLFILLNQQYEIHKFKKRKRMMILKYVMRDVFSSPKGWSGIINDMNKMFCLKQQDVHNPRLLATC